MAPVSLIHHRERLHTSIHCFLEASILLRKLRGLSAEMKRSPLGVGEDRRGSVVFL